MSLPILSDIVLGAYLCPVGHEVDLDGVEELVEVYLRLWGQQLHLGQVNLEAAEAVREVEGGAARELRLQVKVMTQLEHLVGSPAFPTLAARGFDC